MALSGQAGYNNLSEEYDPRAAFLVSNTWGPFGALFSVAYSNRSLREEGFSTVRWSNNRPGGSSGSPPATTCSGQPAGTADCWDPTIAGSDTTANVNWEDTADFSTPGGLAVMNNANTFFPRIPRFGRLSHEQDRLGITSALQWRPSERTEITLDFMYSDFSANRQEDFLENFGFSRTAGAGGLGLIDVVSATTEANGSLLTGEFNDVWIRSESRRDQLQTVFQQYVLTGTHEFSDRFRINFLAGSALSQHDNPEQTSLFIDAFVSGYQIDFSQNRYLPNIDMGTLTNSPSYGALGGATFDPTNPTHWQWRTGANSTPPAEIRLRPQGADNWFRTAQLDFEFDVTDNLSLSVGDNWKEFEFESFESRRFGGGASQTLIENAVPSLAQFNGAGGMASLTQLLSGFGKNFDIGPDVATAWLRPDFDAIASAFDIYCNCVNAFGDFRTTPLLTASNTVTETDNGFYAQVDFNFDLGGMAVRGDVGARYAETQIESRGFVGTTPVTVENSYTDTLPALNFVLEATDDIQIRFAANKAMARPPLPRLTPGGTVTTAPASASMGNPMLDPYRSTNYDLGFEWYFAPESLLSVALFYKDIESYIQVTRQLVPYGDTGLPLTLLAPGQDATTIFNVTQARNTPGGTLSGFEVSYQQPFTFLPGFLSNFGTVLNYTSVESDIQYITNVATNTTVTAPLLGLSPTSYNATLYYEDDTFSARVSASYRDEYLLAGSIVNVPAQNNNFFVGKEESLNWDAAASWTLNDHLSFNFEGINLTDEANSQWVGDQAGTRQNVYVYHHTGRQLYFGFRYKY